MDDFKHPVQAAIEAQTSVYSDERTLGREEARARFLRRLWWIAFFGSLGPLSIAVLVARETPSGGLGPNGLVTPLITGIFSAGTLVLALRAGRRSKGRSRSGGGAGL